jgi:hypothetical protein
MLFLLDKFSHSNLEFSNVPHISDFLSDVHKRQSIGIQDAMSAKDGGTQVIRFPDTDFRRNQ